LRIACPVSIDVIRDQYNRYANVNSTPIVKHANEDTLLVKVLHTFVTMLVSTKIV